VTTPTTTTYDELKNLQNDLIRKALEGSVFIAPYSPPSPTALTTGANAGLVPLATDYEDVGWCDKGTGATWSRSVDTSDVTSWGSVEPTRRDITKETKGIKFIAQETKRQTIELYEGVDLSTVTPTAVTGESHVRQPRSPADAVLPCVRPVSGRRRRRHDLCREAAPDGGRHRHRGSEVGRW
jgi:hypothetical protein